MKLECELPSVQSFAEVSLRDCFLAHPADAVHPSFLLIDEVVVHFAGAIGTLNRRRHQRTAAGTFFCIEPLKPVVEESTQTRLARPRLLCGYEHSADKFCCGGYENRALHRYLGTEIPE